MGTTSFPVGEMLHMRRPNAKTWMNSDGSFTTEVFPEPIHYEDATGNLHNINTDLFDEADFDFIDETISSETVTSFGQAKETAKVAKNRRILNRDDYGFQGLKVPFDVKIPRSFRKGYTVGKGKDRVTFLPVGASTSKGELANEDRSRIHYQDVWNDTDVELKLLPNGLKETFILKTDKAPNSFSFELKGKDISEDLMLGEMKLLPAWLMDAAGTYRDVAMEIERKNDNKTFIHVQADLTDLVYPVEIDPTVVIPASAIKATDVRSTNPTTNYSSAAFFRAGIDSKMYGLLKLDLNQIKGNIESAGLTMTVSGYGTQYSRSVQIRRITSDWNFDTVTWNTKPTFDVNNVPNTQQLVLTGTNTFDIKEYVQGIASGQYPNYGLLVDVIGQSADSWKEWSESSLSLTIKHSFPPTTPVVTSPVGGSAFNALHRVSWQTSNPNPPVAITVTKTDGVSASSGILNGSYNKLAQGFTTPGAVSRLRDISLDFAAISTGQKVRVWLADYNIATNSYGNPITTPQEITVTTAGVKVINILGKVLPETRYFIVVELIAGANTTIDTYGKNFNISALRGNLQVFSAQNGSIATNAPETSIVTTMNYDNPIEYLQHEVQLSTNGGTTWKTIGTTLNQQFLDYDFINEPETSIASIRVRAFDGFSYSEWGMSNSVFTIIHNQAPNMPSNLSPTGGKALDRAVANRLSWVHSDPNNDPQSKFDLQWRLKGTGNWNLVASATPNNFYDISGLPYGEIEWRVRTYDQANLVSPYSNISTFLAGNKPSAPVISSPANNAVVPIANPVIQWSSSDQMSYKLVIKKASGAIVWQDEKISGIKAITANANLSNQQTYTVELSIINQDGLQSNLHSIRISVSYTQPAIPGLAIQGFDYQAKIQLTMMAPTPIGTQPSVTHHDVYRRVKGQSVWMRIATNAPVYGIYNDLTPKSGESYEYFVRAWGDNGTYRDSPVVSSSITLSSIWLMDPSDSGSLHHFHYFEPGRSAERTFAGQLMEFEGRRHYMAEFSPRETQKVSMVLQLKKDSDDLLALNDLLERRTTLLYRDAKGRRLFGVIFVLAETETDYGYTVPIEVQAVGYEEEV